MADLVDLAAHEVAAGMRRREFSSRDLTQAVLDRISDIESEIHAFITVTGDAALRQADAVDERRARREDLPPLAGIPVALKDNLCTRGTRTTAGSRILQNHVAQYDATVVSRLREQGVVFIGKTNLDEFAMGSSTENSWFGPTHNPWDLRRVPGGSSGGSAAAVASGEATLAIGSDTGGSIRQPASFCGVVGVKPTYGRVSRQGLIAFASSLDQIGPIARNVLDCALLFAGIAGHDDMDATSAPQPVPDCVRECGRAVAGLRVGLPEEFFECDVDPAVANLVHAAVQVLAEQGATVDTCSFRHVRYGLAAYYIVAPAEASSNLARYDGVRYGVREPATDHTAMTDLSRGRGFGAEVKQRVMVGTYALSSGYYEAFYRRAQQARTLIRNDFTAAFARFDVLVTPTTPCVAFHLGEKSDPLAMKRTDVCTLPAPLAGVPGLSVPCGFVDGLPVGLQIMAKPFAEDVLFRIAYAYEQATPWHAHRPAMDCTAGKARN